MPLVLHLTSVWLFVREAHLLLKVHLWGSQELLCVPMWSPLSPCCFVSFLQSENKKNTDNCKCCVAL